jgi:DNA-3-methyladenine glycosylase I
MSYCRIAGGHPFHGPYHDREYGFPVRSDAALFERLALEINQAGLSWLTMLTKREGFRRAYEGFDPEVVARFGERKYDKLMADAGIIRNRLKIRAVIENAKRLLAIRESHGSFAKWLDAHHPLSPKEWQKLFKETFVFTGGEIVGSFLISTGYLRGAHVPGCPVYARVAKKRPAWLSKRRKSRSPRRAAQRTSPRRAAQRMSS